MDNATLIAHGITVGSLIIAPALGVLLGQGRLTAHAIRAIDLQSHAKDEVSRAGLIALVLAETSALICLLAAAFIFFNPPTYFYQALARCGIIPALALPGFIIGMWSAYPVAKITEAIARQPMLFQPLFRLMIIGQIFLQSPLIFGAIISSLIVIQASLVGSCEAACIIIASGLALGITTLGTTHGLSKCTAAIAQSIGSNREALASLSTFTFISQAFIEGPLIFALLTAGILLFVPFSGTHQALRALIAACVFGVSAASAGYNSGKSAAAAAQSIAQNPAETAALRRLSMFSQTLIDTSAIYGFLIVLMLVLAGK